MIGSKASQQGRRGRTVARSEAGEVGAASFTKIWGIGWPQSLGQFVSIRFTDEKPQKPNAMQNRYP
jgi:hypothetical protein